jgi:cytoskeletal protein RodZ
MDIIPGLLILIIGFCLYFAPSFIAFKRRHEYKLVILGINVIGFVGVLPWIIAFVWAAWPNNKSIIDPVVGNVTGKGRRNTGDTIGAAGYGLTRGYDEEKFYSADKTQHRADS